MTIIYWDGVDAMYADRTAWDGSVATESAVPKPMISPDGRTVVAATGDWSRLRELQNWVLRGADPADYPPTQEGESAGAIAITGPAPLTPLDFEVRVYYHGAVHPVTHRCDRELSIGSGSEVAMGVNATGQTDGAIVLHLVGNVLPSCSLGADMFRYDREEGVWRHTQLWDGRPRLLRTTADLLNCAEPTQTE